MCGAREWCMTLSYSTPRNASTVISHGVTSPSPHTTRAVGHQEEAWLEEEELEEEGLEEEEGM